MACGAVPMPTFPVLLAICKSTRPVVVLLYAINCRLLVVAPSYPISYPAVLPSLFINLIKAFPVDDDDTNRNLAVEVVVLIVKILSGFVVPMPTFPVPSIYILML